VLCGLIFLFSIVFVAAFIPLALGKTKCIIASFDSDDVGWSAYDVISGDTLYNTDLPDSSDGTILLLKDSMYLTGSKGDFVVTKLIIWKRLINNWMFERHTKVASFDGDGWDDKYMYITTNEDHLYTVIKTVPIVSDIIYDLYETDTWLSVAKGESDNFVTVQATKKYVYLLFEGLMHIYTLATGEWLEVDYPYFSLPKTEYLATRVTGEDGEDALIVGYYEDESKTNLSLILIEYNVTTRLTYN